MHALVINGRQDEAISILDYMLEGSNEDGVLPGTSSFTVCILGAIQSKDFTGAMRLNEKMRKAGVESNATIFKSVLIANARVGGKDDVIEQMESAITSQTQMDAQSFLLCAKYLIPSILKDAHGDIEMIRTYLRQQVERSPDIRDEAMELNKSLKDCLREDRRKPSKMKNNVMIKMERDKLWRIALKDAIKLYRILDTQKMRGFTNDSLQ
jgi:hypothetical protein